jgi:hypothetical protein
MPGTAFSIVKDIVEIHAHRGQEGQVYRPHGGVISKYRSLPPAGFVLALAVAQEITKRACRARGIVSPTTSSLTITSKNFVSVLASHGVTLAARARIAPSIPGASNIWRWDVLTGTNLQSYLGDAIRLRNCIAHQGNLDGLQLATTYYGAGRETVNLMMTEGLLQATQDVCFLVEQGVAATWDWQLPARSKTGAMPRRLSQDPRFPLP